METSRPNIYGYADIGFRFSPNRTKLWQCSRWPNYWNFLFDAKLKYLCIYISDATEFLKEYIEYGYNMFNDNEQLFMKRTTTGKPDIHFLMLLLYQYTHIYNMQFKRDRIEVYTTEKVISCPRMKMSSYLFYIT